MKPFRKGFGTPKHKRWHNEESDRISAPTTQQAMGAPAAAGRVSCVSWVALCVVSLFRMSFPGRECQRFEKAPWLFNALYMNI